VGEYVLLNLQPYAQSTVVNRPFPKLALKYFDPYKVLEKLGTVAYKLQLPPHSVVHPVFHVSQLKAFTPDHSPVFSSLPDIPALDSAEFSPEVILDRRLVKKGNVAITQVLVQWTGLSASSATWDDYSVLREKFPSAAAWGQTGASAGGIVTAGHSSCDMLKG
jgi:hypothetical protein